MSAGIELVASGCKHPTIDAILNGTFLMTKERHHAMPVFKKTEQVRGLDIMLYFWDERDGPALSGWWFGPSVGADQVWGSHPQRTSGIPPEAGWQVPSGGEVDPNFRVIVRQMGQEPAAQRQPQPLQQQPQQPLQEQEPHWAQDMEREVERRRNEEEKERGETEARRKEEARRDAEEASRKRFEEAKQRQEEQRQQLEQQKELHRKKQEELEELKRRKQEELRQAQEAKRWAEEEAKRQRIEQEKRQKEEIERQQEEQRKRLEEMKKQAEERQKRIKEEQIRLHAEQVRLREEQEKERERQRKQKEEEEQRRKEQANKKAAELKSAGVVRRSIQKIRVVTHETMDQLVTELRSTLAEELENLGSLRPVLETECEKAITLAKKRLEQREEQRQKAADKQKEDVEKRKQLEVQSKELHDEVDRLCTAAECDSLGVTVAWDRFSDKGPEEEVSVLTGLLDKVDAAHALATKTLKRCTDFIVSKRTSLKDLQRLKEQQERLSEYTKSIGNISAKSKEARPSLGRRLGAYKKLQSLKALFGKYDSNADGVLSRDEVLAYAQGEFKFSVPDKSMDAIMRHNADEDAGGVPFSNFTWVKMAIGTARELQREEAREREKHEVLEKVESVRSELKEKIQEATQAAEAAEQEVVTCEKRVQDLKAEAKGGLGEGLVQLMKELDTLTELAKTSLAATRSQFASLGSDLKPAFKEELSSWIAAESKKQDIRLGRMDQRLSRVEALCRQVRDDSVRKRLGELQSTWTGAVRLIRHTQLLRRRPTGEDMFEELDTKADGVLDEEEFLAFFEATEKTLQDLILEDFCEAEAEENVEAERQLEPAAEEEAPEKAAPTSTAETAPVLKGPDAEKRACMAIRRVIQKLRVATPANFDELQKELEQAMEKDLENTGAQKDKLRIEGEKGLSLAKKRVEQKMKDQPPPAAEPVKNGTAAPKPPADPQKAACMAIRRVIQKLRVASPSTFEGLKGELEEVMAKELENTGKQKDQLQLECEKGLELARKRVETAKKNGKDTDPKEAAAEPAAAAAAAPAAAAAEERVELEVEALKKLFGQLCDNDSFTMTKDAFARFMRVYMRVGKETALTSRPQSSAGKVLRRLSPKEAVEVLRGPLREKNTGVLRLEAIALKDGLTGWVTSNDGKGNACLRDGGRTFKVVRETVLTENLDLESQGNTRKLKTGELLESLDRPAKEEQTAMMRMRVKSLFDGSVGFVTITGNQGTTFVELA